MDLSKTGLDATQQVAVEAMSEAHDAKDWAKCAAVGDAWLEARGEMPALCAVWYAQSLLSIGRVQDALVWAKVAAQNIPSSETLGRMAAMGCYAQVLAALGYFGRSRKVFREMVLVEHEHPEAREKLGHITLAVTDKWAKGWALHEARLENDKRPFPENCRPWNGVSQEPVAVLHEQGIGDAVLTARWLDIIAERTGHAPTWYGPKLLHRWIGAHHQLGDIDADAGRPLTAAYTMSLAHLAGVRRPKDLPAPYAPAELRELRADHRPDPARFRVGLCWKGAEVNYHNFERSYAPADFAAIWQPIDGVEFVNLCHDADVDGAPFERRMFADVYETGEIVTGLDLVVSVDTAVVHIAGSLGVPTLALLPTKIDWRYPWPYGGQSLFYPSVMSVRRPASTDLGAIVKARRLLEQLVAASRKKARVADACATCGVPQKDHAGANAKRTTKHAFTR